MAKKAGKKLPQLNLPGHAQPTPGLGPIARLVPCWPDLIEVCHQYAQRPSRAVFYSFL